MTIRTGCLVLAALLWAPLPAAGEEDDPVLWPDRQREFLLDGVGLLLSESEREELTALPASEREAWIGEFLRDPIPETPQNELQEGIRRRRALVRREYLTPLDDRARVLFLHGPPSEWREIRCGQAFKPLEVWSYGEVESPRRALFYEPAPGRPFRLWFPLETKRVLYNPDMAYLLSQIEELGGRIIGPRRLDRRECPDASLVDDVTGIEALRGYRPRRPTDRDFALFLEPPEDLAAWARTASADPPPESPPRLAVEDLQIVFPEHVRQRMISRFLVTLGPEAGLEPVEVDGRSEYRIGLDGVVEQDGEVFEEFRMRFRLEPPEGGVAVALAFERPLRPERSFLVRLRIRDEGSGSEALLARGFQVPAEAQELAELAVPEDVVVSLGEQLEMLSIGGRDSLILVPPDSDVIMSFWRADALVTGSRISKVVFSVDGQPQLTRTRRPFSAELRLAHYPLEQVVRAEGYDADGELVASDQVIVNRPRGSFRVRILEPGEGADLEGTTTARAEITVPDGRRVLWVEFRVDDQPVARLDRPPWRTEIQVPAGEQTSYLSVVASLDDGATAEEVRFLRSPENLASLEVNLVELFTTVVDRSRRPVSGLEVADFEVLENGRPQQISKFELVQDLPLTLGIALDASGSMGKSLPEARRAAIGFLRDMLRPGDRAFALSFARRPTLLMPPTDDLAAVEAALVDVQSLGWTALHDAVISSLYYFRGFRGRRALVLLSDGNDTSSRYPFRDVLEYARRSGVVVYSVGLDISSMKIRVRGKLTELAEETGGRVFFIQRAEELAGVYREIEGDLRSQYLLAYSSDDLESDGFRRVEVKVRDGRLKARTMSGYYPGPG